MCRIRDIAAQFGASVNARKTHKWAEGFPDKRDARFFATLFENSLLRKDPDGTYAVRFPSTSTIDKTAMLVVSRYLNYDITENAYCEAQPC